MGLRFLDVLELRTEWERVEPLFQKVADKAVHGEFSVDDLHRMARDGGICVGCVDGEDGLPVMALAFEFVDYPSGVKAINVLAMGGHDLDGFMRRYWEPLQDWARSQGCAWIECYVSPGMERMHRRYGLKTVYRMMRMDLKKEG